ncbi:MAG: hypothetical protein PHC63_08995, partial [Candidatus Bathyarchaeota archaeon]|nr:hypothetical protein [Candidatus Bathyarchaeota archaeon]
SLHSLFELFWNLCRYSHALSRHFYHSESKLKSKIKKFTSQVSPHHKTKTKPKNNQHFLTKPVTHSTSKSIATDAQALTQKSEAIFHLQWGREKCL